MEEIEISVIKLSEEEKEFLKAREGFLKKICAVTLLNRKNPPKVLEETPESA